MQFWTQGATFMGIILLIRVTCREFHTARCKTCTAQESGIWYENNKDHHKENVKVKRRKSKERAREFVYQYLLAHPCDGKDREIERMVAEGFSVGAIAAEIARCQVLCSNCHKRLTAEERGWFKRRGR